MFNEIYNFLQVSDAVYSSGMPTVDQMHEAPGDGVQVVINLTPNDAPEALAGEADLVKSLGMEYIHIPVRWSTPTRQGLDLFIEAMDRLGEKKIWIHCEANFRATAFVTMYRILRQGWAEEDAFKAMHDVWDEDSYPVWKSFIDANLQESRQGKK